MVLPGVWTCSSHLVLSHLISDSLERMDQVIEGLQARKGELLAKIHLLNAECSSQFAKYQQLGEGQQDEEEASQLQALSKNILAMEAQVLQLNSNCRAAVASKKDKLSAIRTFQDKRERLSVIAANERAVLADTVALNEGIEESIKTSRDQYESCQEEIYELGLKEDRVKQSGTKLVQQSTLELQGQRDALLDNITEIQQQLKVQRGGSRVSIPKGDLQLLNIRNDKLLRKREKLRLLAKENQQLAVQNQQLSEAKLRYESTPHFEIKTLESSLQLQETKIGVIEREIASIHRKYVEGQQKIQHFKEQYKEQHRQQGSTDQEHIVMAQNDPREKFRCSQENSLYQEIRTELDQGMPREASYDSRKSEKAVRKGTEEGEAEGRCYRSPRRINWLQFWLVVLFLSGTVTWCLRLGRK